MATSDKNKIDLSRPIKSYLERESNSRARTQDRRCNPERGSVYPPTALSHFQRTTPDACPNSRKERRMRFSSWRPGVGDCAESPMFRW